MLVCNISMRPHHHQVAAEILEAGAAEDVPGGEVIFLTIVDDPASASESSDAYIGQIMLEAASASDLINEGYQGNLSDSLSATESEDATVTTPPAFSTWNPSDKTSAITLSGGNLTASATAGGNQGVRSTRGQLGGKFYFEALCSNTTAQNIGPGVVNPTVALSTFTGNVVGGAAIINSSGAIFVNGSNVGSVGSAVSAGQTLCFAVDLVNYRLWARINAGNWNNSGTANPATNTGGLDISAVFSSSVACHAVFGTTNGSNACTANFGASSFAYTVPSGFSAGPS
jgi:hypothetical protein